MFLNVTADSNRKGFFTAEVSDLNGRLHTIDGVWAKDIVSAHSKFEKIASDWDTFDAPSDEAMIASTNALLAEIAVWGSE